MTPLLCNPGEGSAGGGNGKEASRDIWFISISSNWLRYWLLYWLLENIEQNILKWYIENESRKKSFYSPLCRHSTVVVHFIVIVQKIMIWLALLVDADSSYVQKYVKLYC